MQKRKGTLVGMLLTGLLMVASSCLAAGWVNPGLLVDADTVKANIDKPDWVVIDARDLKDYLDGHIPGAISLGNRGKKALRDTTARVFNDISRYESILGKVGIDNNTHVVFYHGDLKTMDDASVGFWVLEYLGHDKVHVLEGGLEAWRNAGNRLDKTPTMKEAKTFTAHVRPERYASTAEIVEIAKGNPKGTQLIDARTAKEHDGTDIRTLLGGHVPNTLMNSSNLDTLKKVPDPKTGKDMLIAYIDQDATIKAFGNLDSKKRTVAYCQTGTRSTQTYLQLRLMGFENPANWDESWRVYASDLHAANPIEAPNGPQFYNFDNVNKDLKDLKKKVAALEEKLAAPAPK